MSAAPPNGNGANRIGIYASVFMALTVVVGAFIWVGGIASQVQQNQSVINSQALRISALEIASTTSLVQATSVKSALIEIETQFHASDQLSDVRIAEDLRWRCMFFVKVYNQACPQIAYFPQIARGTQTGQ